MEANRTRKTTELVGSFYLFLEQALAAEREEKNQLGQLNRLRRTKKQCEL